MVFSSHLFLFYFLPLSLAMVRTLLGFPPITNLTVVAGQYRVDIVCDTGPNPPGQFVTVVPNQTATVRVF